MISLENKAKWKIGQTSFRNECLSLCSKMEKREKLCKQVNSRVPCILMSPRFPGSLAVIYSCYFVSRWIADCVVTFRFPTTAPRTHERSSLCRAALPLGISPRVPDARREVCRQGGCAGDARAENPLRTHGSRLQASLQQFSPTSWPL